MNAVSTMPMLNNLQHAAPPCCSICSSASLRPFGAKDFGHSGNDHFVGRRTFSDYGTLIPYLECLHCGFVFCYAFDKWQNEDFEQHIYNEDYILADPPFHEERPALNARRIAALFDQELYGKRVLDVGGGNGGFTHAMRQLGIQAFSHDPHFGITDPQVRGASFDLVTAFEVIEHVPHAEQQAWINTVAGFLRDSSDSVAIISTETRVTADSIDWWYICPRNGHISIHTSGSLRYLCLSHGLATQPIGQGLHAVFRRNLAQQMTTRVGLWQAILRGSLTSCAAD